MYGNQWEPAVPVFHILSVSIPLQIVLTTIGSIYQAAGDTKNLFFTGLVSSIVTIIGFIIALLVFHSVVAVAWSWNVSVLIGFIVNYYVLYKITLHESIADMMVHCKYPLLGVLISSSILLLCSKFIAFESMILNISLKFTIVGLVFLSLLFFTKKLNIHMVKKCFKRKNSII